MRNMNRDEEAGMQLITLFQKATNTDSWSALPEGVWNIRKNDAGLIEVFNETSGELMQDAFSKSEPFAAYLTMAQPEVMKRITAYTTWLENMLDTAAQLIEDKIDDGK